jgi:RNA polymerase-binding transcription factor DksA
MPLTKTQLKSLEKQLSKRVSILRGKIVEKLVDSGQTHYVNLAGEVADSGDEAVADMLADLDAAIVDRHVEEMRDIEAARARLNEGTFGVCVSCSGDIGYERLLAFPTAKRCISCQSVREKTMPTRATPPCRLKTYKSPGIDWPVMRAKPMRLTDPSSGWVKR